MCRVSGTVANGQDKWCFRANHRCLFEAHSPPPIGACLVSKKKNWTTEARCGWYSYAQLLRATLVPFRPQNRVRKI